MPRNLPKNYALVLIPEEKISKAIMKLREKEMGTALIDGFPPHLTLKSRFWLNEGSSLEQLMEILTNFPITSLIVAIEGQVEYPDSLVLAVGPNKQLIEYHHKISEILKPHISTYRHESREGKNYNPHLTLWRGKKKADKDFLKSKKFSVIALSLYEMDPVMTKRSFAREVWSKKI